MKILRNSIRCLRCGDEVESRNRHDFVFCLCGKVAVDGGREYLRRIGSITDWEDTSIMKEDWENTDDSSGVLS